MTTRIGLRSPWSRLRDRDSWTAWLAAARQRDPWMADFWSDLDGCHGCAHLDAPGVWCRLLELPATRNPVLNMLGMACCGAGFELAQEQTELFATTTATGARGI